MNNSNQNKEFGKLSLEQQFQLRVIERDINNLSLKQAREYLREAFRQIMIKENLYRKMFRECFF